MIGGLDISRCQRTRGGDDVDVDVIAADKRLRRRQARTHHRCPLPHQAEANEPRLFFEKYRIGQCATVAFAIRRQNVSGADIRMAGEWQFRTWREDANLRGVRGILRRQNEGCFREVELRSDGLHLLACQRSRLRHDRKLVAAEFAIGEDVDSNETNLHGRNYCRGRAPRRGP